MDLRNKDDLAKDSFSYLISIATDKEFALAAGSLG
jgi:hypothetical protein